MSGWDEAGRWRWGKAGQRLDEAAAEERRRARLAEANRARAHREVDDRRARELYEAGQLAPWRITMSLDSKELYGPEVDAACGAREPDVDLWEAGELYPTWEQVLKLAELCGCTPRFLMHDPSDAGRIDWNGTTLRFHDPNHTVNLVERFTPAAIRARLWPRPDDEPPELVARYAPGDQVALFDPEPAR